VAQRLSKAFLILVIIGLALAVYHAYDEITAFTGFGSQVCNFKKTISCESVFESGLTSLAGIPFYVLGLVWFPLLLILAAYFTGWGKGAISYPTLLLPVLMIGNVFTIYLWYLEIGVLGIICPICVSMYVVNYGLTGMAAAALR
jgi:uncharacterized membrane protein